MSIGYLQGRISECEGQINVCQGYVSRLKTAKERLGSFFMLDFYKHVTKMNEHKNLLSAGTNLWEGTRVKEFKDAYSALTKATSSFSSESNDAILKIDQEISKYNIKISNLQEEIRSCRNQISDIEAAMAIADALSRIIS